jgi:hypothetical protein
MSVTHAGGLMTLASKEVTMKRPKRILLQERWGEKRRE